MRNFLSVLLFTPLLLQAQQPLHIKEPYGYPNQVKAVREKKGRLTIVPAKTKWLYIGGNYTVSTAANLINPSPYPDNIFRTGNTISQSLSLRASINKDHWNPLWAFSLKAGNNAETTVLPENRNTTRNVSLSAQRNLEKFSITGSYGYFSSRFSNDYPWFFLKDYGHLAHRTQQTGNLSLQKNKGYFTLGVITTLDIIKDTSNQSVKPGTAGFPMGLLYTRMQNDDHYSSNAFLAYNFRDHAGAVWSTARLNYIYDNEKVTVDYPANRYAWQRSANDAALTFNTIYDGYYLSAGLNAGNKFYESTTSLKTTFFLPELGGYIAPRNLLDNHLYAKLTAGFTSFCSELPINHTLSPFLLTQLTPQESFTFIPSTEVRSFSNLSPMQHQEFTSGIQLEFDHIISLHANFSIRNTKDDQFPAYENKQLVLKNMADTRYKGYDVQLQFNSPHKNFRRFHSTNSLSFSNSPISPPGSSTATTTTPSQVFPPFTRRSSKDCRWASS